MCYIERDNNCCSSPEKKKLLAWDPGFQEEHVPERTKRIEMVEKKGLRYWSWVNMGLQPDDTPASFVKQEVDQPSESGWPLSRRSGKSR